MKGISLLGALALLSSFLPSCLQRERTRMTRISLVRTTDRTKGVPKAIDLLGVNPVRGKAIVLKPNFNSADDFPGSTHNDTLRALVQTLKEMGAKRITLAERSGPGDTTRQVMEKKGIFNLAEELGFDIVNLQEIGEEDWIHMHPENSHWKDGFKFPRIYSEAESIVQTCCLKTHAYGGHFTLSLKNSVGMVPGGNPYMSELHSVLNSQYQRQMIAEINTAYSPDIIVLDGVEAFVSGGPARGTRVESGVIVAGSDRVAIDAVGVAILRLLGTTTTVSEGPIFEQDQIARAAELGLEIQSADQIQLVTDDPESEEFAVKVRDILLGS